MNTRELIELVTNLAWPSVGLLTLIYVWRSDAVGKLIKISDAVKDLRERLAELVEIEERLRHSTSSISGVNTTINQIQEDFLSMKADVENIRDNVDQRTDPPIAGIQEVDLSSEEMGELFERVNSCWQSLSDTMQDKFGWFDGRRTGSEAYRFAHGNRKSARLSYDQADEVARLHSSIKSYRRRQGTLGDWLTPEIANEFCFSASSLESQIREL